ncbi:MAG: hypothetical protein ACE5HP_05185 [Gemmatimonadota bacterium]
MVRRIRWRRLRRRLLPALMAGAIGVAMATSVRRGARARELSRQLEALTQTEGVTRDRLRGQVRRADSLGTRARIRVAAGRLGLRPATDREIVFLGEVGEGTATRRTRE